MIEGEVVEWESFDMGGGGGGGLSCEDIFKIERITDSNSADFLYSGIPFTGAAEPSDASGLAQEVCDNFLAVSGECVEVGYVFGKSGSHSGQGGPYLKFKQGKSFAGFHTFLTGVSGEITGADGDYNNFYEAHHCNNFFGFEGVSGIETFIKTGAGITHPRLKIGGPSFTASGCALITDTNTETNTVTYGLDRSGLITCLGYEENIVRMLIATGSGEAGLEPPEGPITSLTGESGVPYFNLCDFTILRKCPEESGVYLSGCCDPEVGACCYNGNCSVTTEDNCDGYYWGDGTNCTDQPSAGSAPYYSYTIAQLCEEGIGCVYNTSPPGMGGGQIGYECYNGEFGGPTCSRKEYLDHVYSDTAYHADEAAGVGNPSTFEVGVRCDDEPYPCPTTTTTTTSTTTSTTTTTPIW
jgi:hypothetical protein